MGGGGSGGDGGARLAASKDELKGRHGARVTRTHVAVAVLVEHHAAAIGEQNVVRRCLAVLDRLAHHDACAGQGQWVSSGRKGGSGDRGGLSGGS